MLMTQSNALIANDEDIFNALKDSVYPGAKETSIKMVLSYCKAAKLDPLKKPVHIVPMNVKDAMTQKYEYRDVVMQGIGHYRTIAHRTGQYMGLSEPEFGPLITKKFDKKEVTYPEWCKIIVYKLINNQIVSFPATEYWEENYATAGKDTIAPNSMWTKRARGQLAKCTEAQALRKAFPEELGDAPIAEEMEGKIINNDNDVAANGNRAEKLKNLVSQAKEVVVDEQITQEENPSYTFEELKNMMLASVSVQSLNSLLPLLKDFKGEKEELAALRQIYKDMLQRPKEIKDETQAKDESLEFQYDGDLN